MVAATMKISEYAVLIYNFQTGIANRSIVVIEYCKIAYAFNMKYVMFIWTKFMTPYQTLYYL